MYMLRNLIKKRVDYTYRFVSLTKTPKCYISFARGTEKLRDTNDPTLRKNIESIERADKRDGKETLVIKNGVTPSYDYSNRLVNLPLGHDDPVQASHELQHASDFVNLDYRPPQEVLERRAFSAQKKTADHLNLSDQLNGKTPEQRAREHSQVVNKRK